MLHLLDGELLNEGMYVWASLTTRRDTERKAVVGSGEWAPTIVFLPFSVKVFLPWHATFSRLKLTQGLTIVMMRVMVSKSALFLHRGLAVEEYPRLHCDINAQRVGPAGASAISLSEGPHVFNDEVDFALAEGSSQHLVEHSVEGERAHSRPCAKHSVEAGGLLSATIAVTQPTNYFRRVMQSPVKGFPLQEIIHRVFLQDPQKLRNNMVSFSRPLLGPYHCSLRRVLLQVSEVLQELFSTVLVEGVRKLGLDKGPNPPAHSSDARVCVCLCLFVYCT